MADDEANSPYGALGDLVDAIFGEGPKAKKSASDSSTASKIRSKTIDGVLYLRADDLADALERDAPTTCAGLIRKLRRK